MNERKINSKLLCIIFLIITIPLTAFAHSGRTDSSGGHRDNKNKSGLGSYHYHCGGYPAHLHTNGVCPYKGGGSSSTSSKPAVVYASRINAVNVPTSINAGESTKLEGAVYPTNAQDKEIKWASDNPEIVSVTSAGELKAVGVGTATVTATTSRGTTSKFTITVNEVFAQSITIEKKPVDILVGGRTTVSVAFNPENTTNKTIEWTSDNDEIISVSEGVLTAKKPGVATITATHGALQDSFMIEVLPIEAESVEILCPEKEDGSEENRLKKGEQLMLQAVVLPENTTNKTIKWSVNDNSIAEIDEDGALTAIGTGKVIVTATASNGIKSEIEVEFYSDITAGVAGVGGVTAAAIGAAYFIKRRKRTE